jgi:hypothetical protein
MYCDGAGAEERWLGGRVETNRRGEWRVEERVQPARQPTRVFLLQSAYAPASLCALSFPRLLCPVTAVILPSAFCSMARHISTPKYAVHLWKNRVRHMYVLHMDTIDIAHVGIRNLGTHLSPSSVSYWPAREEAEKTVPREPQPGRVTVCLGRQNMKQQKAVDIWLGQAC